MCYRPRPQRRPSHVEDLELKAVNLHHLAQGRAEAAGQQCRNDRQAYETDAYEQAALQRFAEFDTDAHS